MYSVILLQELSINLRLDKYIEMLQVYRQKTREARNGEGQGHKAKERTDSEHFNEDYFLNNI